MYRHRYHQSATGSRVKSLFFFSSRRRHTRSTRDWSSDVCSSDLREAQHAAGFRRPARVDLRERFMLRKHALDQHLDVSAGLLFPEEPRLDHPGVVEYQQVAGREQLRQFEEAPVGEGGADAEQAASRSLRVRILRDQLRRQLVVEIVDGKIHVRAVIMHALSRSNQPGWWNW